MIERPDRVTHRLLRSDVMRVFQEGVTARHAAGRWELRTCDGVFKGGSLRAAVNSMLHWQHVKALRERSAGSTAPATTGRDEND